jgi:uncharacterized membrane protein
MAEHADQQAQSERHTHQKMIPLLATFAHMRVLLILAAFAAHPASYGAYQWCVHNDNVHYQYLSSACMQESCRICLIKVLFTSAGLLVTGTFGVTLIHSMAVFLMVRRSVRLKHDESSSSTSSSSKKMSFALCEVPVLVLQ